MFHVFDLSELNSSMVFRRSIKLEDSVGRMIKIDNMSEYIGKWLQILVLPLMSLLDHFLIVGSPGRKTEKRSNQDSPKSGNKHIILVNGILILESIYHNVFFLG